VCDYIQVVVNVRAAARPPLSSHFDAIVVGGGIHGVAIARACALAGKKTLVLDQQDFGAGSTSRAPRIVGDVFNDLERGDFVTARESLRERARLLVERGHLVRPIGGVVALGPDRRRSALEARFGLWLRRRMQSAPGNRPGEFQLARVKRMLEDRDEWSLLGFDDAICEFPERLVAEWLREAKQAGAVARNYTRVLALQTKNTAVAGLVVRDLLSGSEQLLTAPWVINATGPWVDMFCEETGVAAPRAVATVRSAHLVLQRFRGAPECAIYSEGIDGRAVVLHPWNGQYLFGASQSEAANAVGSPHPTDAEIEYLQWSLRKLFPQADFEITAAFAGMSALPAERGLGARLMRNRTLVVDHAEHGVRGLLSVVGGALTTACSAADQCAHRMGIKLDQPANCDYLPGRANGVDVALKQWAHSVAGFAQIPQPTARAIAAWHGRRALCIARLGASAKELRETLCPHTQHIVAEAVNAFQHESAVMLGDVLLRRVPVALAECWSPECTLVAAERIGRVLRWNDAEIHEQVAACEAERTNFLVRPKLRPTLHLRPDSLAA
jgi:glycerol-3-phosphate dehydrogenase